MSELDRLKALRLTIEQLEGARSDDPDSPFLGEEVIARADVLQAIDLFAKSACLSCGAPAPRPAPDYRGLLTRLLQWDHFASAADGPYWIAEIRRVLDATSTPRGDAQPDRCGFTMAGVFQACMLPKGHDGPCGASRE